jgi:transposase
VDQNHSTRHLFADTGYSGDKLLTALSKFGKWSIEIVKRKADTAGFEVLPRRWGGRTHPRLAQS